MRPGEKFPDDQGYIALSDAFVESIADLPAHQIEAILADIVAICEQPGGDHPLSNRSGQKLAGLSMIDVLDKQWRVVFRATVVDDVGYLRVVVAGPRRGAAVYDLADMLRRSGRLTDDEVQDLWEALALFDVVAEDIGLDGWDFRPPAAPDGMVRAAVASGVLPHDIAEVLSKDELTAAMTYGWDESGPNRHKALNAAADKARSGILSFDLSRIFGVRKKTRCGAIMKRTGQRCIRRQDHPGPHRAAP